MIFQILWKIFNGSILDDNDYDDNDDNNSNDHVNDETMVVMIVMMEIMIMLIIMIMIIVMALMIRKRMLNLPNRWRDFRSCCFMLNWPQMFQRCFCHLAFILHIFRVWITVLEMKLENKFLRIFFIDKKFDVLLFIQVQFV